MSETDSKFLAKLSQEAYEAWRNRALAAEDEADRLRAEIERLRAGGCARDQMTTQYCAEAARLAAENERLRAALEWYASSEAWTINQLEGAYGDYGRRARTALQDKSD